MIGPCATRPGVSSRSPASKHVPLSSKIRHKTRHQSSDGGRASPLSSDLTHLERDNSGFPSARLSARGHYAAQQSQGLPR
jgi:hypothetical protein